MKKKLIEGISPEKGNVRKIWMTMRLIVFLFLVSLLHVSASVYSQKTRLNIKVERATLQQVFQLLQEQSDFDFFYKNDQIPTDALISVQFQNETIEVILNKILSGTDLTYHILDKDIVISSKPTEKSSSGQQQKPVSGKVTDTSGAPLPGVSVVVKGTTTGTITNGDGIFSLNNVPDNASLEFSFVGMEKQEVAVAGKKTLNVILNYQTIGLEEVVAIGYGTMKKSDVTGAVAAVTSKEFESRPTNHFGDALEGKIAGVQISKPSGQPSAGYNITIRGVSTITAGSEPLYIVDGVPTTSINQIEPTDIESVTVLKDASAAAIYGASGANGVVLITTKRGSNQGTRVSLNSYYGVASVAKKMDVLSASQYKDLMSEMNYTTDWSLYNANTNWQDEVFRTGRTESSQISVSGGNEKTSFYLSGSYFDQSGVIIANSLERYSFRVNLDHKVSHFLKVGTSVSYNKWHDVSVGEGGRWSMGNGFLTASPVIKIYNPDGSFTSDPFLADLENPVANLTANDHGYNNHRFNGNAYAELSLLKSLNFKSMLGIEEQNGSYHSWIDPLRSRAGRNYQGIAGYSTSLSFYWILENTLNFNKTIGKHNIEAMTGYVASKIDGENSSINARNFGSSAVHTVNAGTQIGATYDEFAKSNASYLGRINYAYADKYLLTGNFRADGSSVFGANHKWGYFPSFSAGWRISKEGFFGENKLVNDLKIRAGWGEVGNDQIGNYASWGLVGPNAVYVIGGQTVPGTAITQMENADLRWEKTAQTNIGLDASLLNNRILFTTDYYIKNTSDMLLNAPIPYSIGLGWASSNSSVATKNIGSMTNKGFEFQASSKNLVGELKWTTDFNISFNRSKITKLEKSVPIMGGFIDNRSAAAIAQEGQPLGTFYGYVAEGVDPQTGNMRYKDLDHSGDLSDGDKTIIGDANPKFTYGLTNSLTFKRFSFSFFFQGVQGNQIFNASRIVTEGMYYPVNQLATVLNRWEKPGDVTNMPKSDRDNLNHNSDVSSRFVENGSYLRLKSTTLGYDFPASVCSKIKAQKIYVYVTGENLLTFTKYSGFDPEVSAYGVGIAPGVDFGSYPQSGSFMFGINLTF
jgi:TonB-linked SusC/RagA family outer membrane protein